MTVVPESEHYTHYQATLVMESKNAFGQPTTIAITNKKALADITAKLKAASAELPQKYRFVPAERMPMYPRVTTGQGHNN